MGQTVTEINLSQDAIDEIDEISGGEWWKQSSRETCINAVIRLVELGISEHAAVDAVVRVAYAIRAEYGN